MKTKNKTGDWILINEFGDIIERSVNRATTTLLKRVWTYSYWENETRTRPQGNLNKVKKYINEKRKIKCSWEETTRTDYENRSI